MRVVVVGAGAMGSLFGGRLHAAGNEVVLVDVWQDHIDAINANGLVIDRDGAQETVPIPASFPEGITETPDLIILFTKTFQTESALNGIRRIISDRCHLMTLQNGIGQQDVITRFMDRSRIIHGITTYPCDLLGPGRIHATGDGYIKFMSVDGETHAILDKVEKMLTGAGFRCEVDPETIVAIWEKLAFNAAMNAVTAVLRLTVGQVGDAAEGRDLARAIVDEVAGVAKKKGILVDVQKIVATMAGAFQAHRDHMPSMLQDVSHQRKTEIDFITGAVVREARGLGLAVPVNETLYRLVKTLEGSYSARS